MLTGSQSHSRAQARLAPEPTCRSTWRRSRLSRHFRQDAEVPPSPWVSAPIPTNNPLLPAPGESEPGKYWWKLAVREKKLKPRKCLNRLTALNPALCPVTAAILRRAGFFPASLAARWGPLRARRLPWQRKHLRAGVTDRRSSFSLPCPRKCL